MTNRVYSPAELEAKAQAAILAWVADAEHAWLAVALDTDHGFPGAEDFASQFSFIDLAGDNFSGIVYLEEDEDAPRFLKFAGLEYWTHIAEHQLPDGHMLRDLPRGTAKL